jgi:hypothetical protein
VTQIKSRDKEAVRETNLRADLPVRDVAVGDPHRWNLVSPVDCPGSIQLSDTAGRNATLAGELRIPASSLIHGSGRVGGDVDAWVKKGPQLDSRAMTRCFNPPGSSEMVTAHSEVWRIGDRNRCFPPNGKVPQPAFRADMFLPKA